MNVQEKIRIDRDFIMVAVGVQISRGMTSIHPDYFDQWGYQHMYDLVVDIVDEMMFSSSETEYMKYLSDEKHFQKMNTDLDWYHMDKSITMLTEDRFNKVAGFSK
jgi:hypothetical protein